KADYKPWTSTISTDEVVKYGSDIVNTNSSFKKIKETVDWLDKYNTKEYSLNLSKYREEQKLLKAKMGELDKLYKLTKELNVKNTETDLAALKDAQDKLDKNNQWLKRISGDIYIDETVKVMNNMIGQSNTAKNN
ncbi:MAG TPA: carboxy terminal-processing peptidase, partial [Ferruginibacter sp.]|nr:carboxy terminal-processing peptidase [Ferruginibacter sp.]